MSIPKFSIDDSSDNIVEALSEAGCVVVTGVTDADLRESIRSEMAPYMADAHVQTKDNPDAFYSGFTRRVSALAARSPSITDNLIIHPLSQKICKSHLLSNGEHGWQLHASAVLEVGPGARDQMLHREEDPFTFFPVPRPNIIVASMWAVSDFTVANGATLLVPGSHKWPADRQAEPHEIFNAEMPAGSVLFWTGGLLHGAGENTTNDWRYGIILTYSLGWVRQEENQYLNLSLERLSELSPQLQRTLGFNMYGEALGYYDPSVLNPNLASTIEGIEPA